MLDLGSVQTRCIEKIFVFWIRYNIQEHFQAKHGVIVVQVLLWALPPRSGELRTQKLKSRLIRTRSLNVLPLKPGVGQHIAHAVLLPGISSLLISTLPIHSPAFFPKSLPFFFLCWLWLTHVSCVGPQNKIGHPAGCRFPCWVPAEYK